MHSINGIIARIEHLELEGIEHCPLAQGFGFALSPKKKFKHSHAQIRTDYFGGGGDQSATLYVGTTRVFECSEGGQYFAKNIDKTKFNKYL